MSPTIARYPSIPFGELNWCYEHGIMYQHDMTQSVEYDKAYFEDYVRKEGSDIALKLNQHRTSLVEKYCLKVLDVGVGSGEFIRSANIKVFGYDINPVAIRWLRNEGLYVDPYAEMPDVDGITLWDTLEHIPNPNLLLTRVRPYMYVFVSLPIFSDLTWVRKSKHYKPNEHYYYYTAKGLKSFMSDLGFGLVELSDAETHAGREDILTFVFKKLMPME